MLGIETDITVILKRIQFIFKNENILTECIKGHEGVSFLGETLGPFKKGNKYKINYFSAIPFIERNVLMINDEEKLDDRDIQRYVFNEVNIGDKLMKQDNLYFLVKLKEFRMIMEKLVEEKKKPKIDLDRYNSYTGNYIDNRLIKILKLAKTDLSTEEEKKMTMSEFTLYNIISRIIKNWRNFFLKNSH